MEQNDFLEWFPALTEDDRSDLREVLRGDGGVVLCWSHKGTTYVNIINSVLWSRVEARASREGTDLEEVIGDALEQYAAGGK